MTNILSVFILFFQFMHLSIETKPSSRPINRFFPIAVTFSSLREGKLKWPYLCKFMIPPHGRVSFRLVSSLNIS